MKTLKDIREVLDKIPEEILSKCQFGIGENTEETVSLIYMGEDYSAIFEKYPALVKINNLIENVKKAQTIMDGQEIKAEEISEDLQQEGITDTYFDKKKD